MGRPQYADAWPWTVTTVGARTMFLTAIATAVYVTYVLFGNFAATTSAHGLSSGEIFARWIAPALASGGLAFAAGMALYLWGRLTGR